MRRPYSAAWWLPGGHLQTLWGKLARKRQKLNLRVTKVETPDGDELFIYSLRAARDAPQLVLLHGLEGTVHSHYVNGILAATRKMGWGGHLVAFRSCGERLNTTCRFYHSGDTPDFALALQWLLRKHPNASFVLAGVSMGGNVLLKYLGELSGSVPAAIRAAAAISVPFDLHQSARRINHGFSRVYQHYFLKSLKQKVLEKRTRYPQLPDPERIAEIATIVEFDDLITAPLHGFQNAVDYYDQSSALRHLRNITIPTLLLSAIDDPFLPPAVLQRVREAAISNPVLGIEFSRRGGHVGFVEGATPWTARYFAEMRIIHFFEQELSKL